MKIRSSVSRIPISGVTFEVWFHCLCDTFLINLLPVGQLKKVVLYRNETISEKVETLCLIDIFDFATIPFLFYKNGIWALDIVKTLLARYKCISCWRRPLGIKKAWWNIRICNTVDTDEHKCRFARYHE